MLQILFLILINSCTSIYSNFEEKHINQICSSFSFDEKIKSDLMQMVDQSQQSKKILSDSNIPLFKVYPDLKKSVAHISLGNLPTPVQKLINFEKALNVKNFYIKRDDLTAKSGNFGGNKLRKLEFLLADAIANNRDHIVTLGFSGSNHALATAWYAKQLGLKSTLILRLQHNSNVVKRNLLLDLHVGAQIIPASSRYFRKLATAHACGQIKLETGKYPYVLPPGGSVPIGVLGYINAVFELKEQIDSGLLQEPDRIYVPVGSAGTIAGILLGVKLAGLKSKVIGIAVEPEEEKDEYVNTIIPLFEATNNLLCDADKNIKKQSLSKSDFQMIYDFTGTDYALFTKEGKEAKEFFKKNSEIELDGVYTAKACAGMLDDITKTNITTDTVLYWHTFCSDSFESITKNYDYKNLPKAFHRHFENEVQELDR